MIIVYLNSGHNFETLDKIKDELSGKILELAPEGCTNKDKIPFMTAGEDLGQRLMVEQVALGSKGDYILIEDSKNEDGAFVRQAIFSTKLEMI
jgi:hypothetical protein